MSTPFVHCLPLPHCPEPWDWGRERSSGYDQSYVCVEASRGRRIVDPVDKSWTKTKDVSKVHSVLSQTQSSLRQQTDLRPGLTAQGWDAHGFLSPYPTLRAQGNGKCLLVPFAMEVVICCSTHIDNRGFEANLWREGEERERKRYLWVLEILRGQMRWGRFNWKYRLVLKWVTSHSQLLVIMALCR